MKISIALCTYNGGKFLKEQLSSIAGQTQLPDELIICDDGSTDNTVSIAAEFAENTSFKTRIINNRHNLGVIKNFEQAIVLCSGDIIALADQDDVWYPDKLERAMEVFSAYPKVGLVFSDAEIVDESLQPMGYRLWDHVGITSSKQRFFKESMGLRILLRQHAVTGATMAFRAAFKSLIIPIPKIWFHDAWIALLIAAVSDTKIFEEPLMKYRQHCNNQIGARQKSFSDRFRQLLQTQRENYHAEYNRFDIAYNTLRSKAIDLCPSDILRLFAAKKQHHLIRSEMSPNIFQRLPVIASELISGNYYRYSRGFKSAVMDFFLQE